jgi:hypothetical protein
MTSKLWNIYFESTTDDLLVVQINAPTEMEAIKLGTEKFQSLVLIHSVWRQFDMRETE